MALRLKRNGVRWVRPLQGGLAGWMKVRLPIEELLVAPPPVA